MPASDLHGPWSSIRRAPMVRIAMPFIAGITLGMVAEPSFEQAVWPLLAITLPALFVVLSPHDVLERWKRGALLATWYCLAGLAWQSLRDTERDPRAPWVGDDHGPYLVRVSVVNSANPRSTRADADLIAGFRRDGAEPLRGRVMLTVFGDSAMRPQAGDQLLIDAELERIEREPDPGGFDRRAWARSRGITHEVLVGQDDWLRVGHERQWTDLFTAARDRVARWIGSSKLPKREQALVKALVLGLRDDLDTEQRDAFARSGTIHVLAVSGMHVGLIYAGLGFLLSWWGKGPRSRVARGLLVLAALWGYSGITGGSPSVLRAAFMFSVFTLAGMGRRQTDHLNSLFAAALCLLLWDPSMLLQAGFLLSFLAVLGIVLWYRPLLALWSPEAWLVKQAWSLTVVSFSAQLLTAPLCMWLFKAFPIWFLPANLIVVAVASIAVYGGVALIVFHAVPYLGEALANGLEFLLRIVSASTSFFASLPYAYVPVRIGALDTVLLYAVILSVTAQAHWRWRGMWRVAVVCLSLVLLSGAYRARQAAQRSAFVVYDNYHGMMAGLVHGRSLVLVSAANSLLAEGSAMKRIEQHARAWGIDEVVPAGADLFSTQAVVHRASTMAAARWRSPDLDIRFISGKSAISPCERVADVLVLHDLDRMPHLSELCPARHWVIATGVRRFVCRELIALGQERGIPVHWVRNDGAFVLSAGLPFD